MGQVIVLPATPAAAAASAAFGKRGEFIKYNIDKC